MVAGLAKFGQHTAARLGVHKGNLRAVCSGAGGLINQTNTISFELGQALLQVSDLISHVMNPRAILLQKFGNR